MLSIQTDRIHISNEFSTQGIAPIVTELMTGDGVGMLSSQPSLGRLITFDTQCISVSGIQAVWSDGTGLLESPQDMCVTVRRCLERDAETDPALDVNITLQSLR